MGSSQGQARIVSGSAILTVALFVLVVAPGMMRAQTGSAISPTPTRALERVDESQLVVLEGQTHPLARVEYDRGPVDPGLALNDLVLVLKRSPERQAAFDAFVTSQYDPHSPNYQHWLTPEQIGAKFGLAPEDIEALCNWLESYGFSIVEVPKDRMTIRFNGTAGLVETAFHTQIHNLDVKGEKHIANMTDPQIPAAIAPMVVGISLHNFFSRTMHHVGNRVRLNPEKGGWEQVVTDPVRKTAADHTPASAEPTPEYGYVDNGGNQHEDITPWDFATIYNVTPLWSASINGSGQTIYIAGRSNIHAYDVSYYQNLFNLPNNPVNVVITNSDPGTGNDDDLMENTSDVEVADAVAPYANIVLVTSSSTGTDGAYLSAEYIVNQGAQLPATPAIMSFSYGACENQMGVAGNSLYGDLWQSAASEGIAVFVASGDSGSAMCDQGGNARLTWYAATEGLAVNGEASTPYDTAVGGTDLVWQANVSKYWNANNSSNNSNAIGYIPEYSWNETCTGDLSVTILEYWSSRLVNAGYTGAILIPFPGVVACNWIYQWDGYVYNLFGADIVGLVNIIGGGGGPSRCASETLGNCFGWPKPSWQANVTGIPSDGVRDLPDVSFFAGTGKTSGSAYLICVSTSVGPCLMANIGTFAEIGGTSLSSPAMAGVMALINQKAGGSWGSPNTELYTLGSQENNTNCLSGSATSSSGCYFNDILGMAPLPWGNDMVCMPGTPQCNSSGTDQFGQLSGYDAFLGYDLATGLGSLNVANVVNAWPKVLHPTTTTETVSPTTIAVGSTSSITISATVTPTSGSGTPTGSITFFNGTTQIGQQALSNGAASMQYNASSLTVGTYPITATYSGDSAFAASTAAPTNLTVVNLPATTTSLSITASPSASQANVGSNVTCTATVAHSSGSAAPTGTVTFSYGGTTLGTGTLNSSGTASYSTTSLAVGQYTVTAVYGGDSNYAGSSSSAATLNVVDFQMAANPATITVTAPGQSGNTALAITPLGGFNQTLAFSCSGLPSESSCTFASATGGETMTVITTAPGSRRNAQSLSGGKALFYAMLLPSVLGLVCTGCRKRNQRAMRLLALFLAVSFVSLCLACGGTGGSSSSPPPNSGTPTGTSTVTVTATVGSLSHQTSITLTVQ
ncbi:MAG: Ig-like domain repeat protein [Candidatus Sulfotelmatobacter sp.]